MFRPNRLLAVAAGAIASLLLLADPAYAAVTPPNSMASMGDSITRGFNACGWYVDCPSRPVPVPVPVNSHYLHSGGELHHQQPELQRCQVGREGG
jgi:hypothetical protein